MEGASTFSILERIDVGETLLAVIANLQARVPFSILERIDVGETGGMDVTPGKPLRFQYPRTDRRG